MVNTVRRHPPRAFRAIFCATACATLVALLHSPAALAGGDDFDGPDDTSVNGPSYYGFVRDTRGVGVAHAEVVLTPPGGNPISVTANILGLYRSHVSKTAPPATVKVTCRMAGYVQVKVTRRQTDPTARQIETTCILQKS